ncbi:MAG: hypothetical protein ACU0BS_13060 [Hasllibacter sp.]
MIERLTDRIPPEWRRHWRRVIAWVRLKVPAGLRLPVGILFIMGGFLAILPVFGLWMIPVGIAVAALDVRPIRRRWSARRGGPGADPSCPMPAMWHSRTRRREGTACGGSTASSTATSRCGTPS